MRRRDFITLLASAAAWPLAARGQQPAVPVIGLLSGVSFEGVFVSALDEIRLGLKDAGFVEGQNLAIEYRSADGHPERPAGLAADLVRRSVAVIIAIGGTRTALAAKAETSTIPIVFATGGDAVATGLVATLNRPGGNVTGISFNTGALAPKRLELLVELVPAAKVIGFLDNTVNPNPIEHELLEKASAIGRQVVVFFAGTEADIERAFADMARQRIDALVISPDAYLASQRRHIASLVERYRLAAIAPWSREAVREGLLMTYATEDVFLPAGVYAGRILKGARPADLPVQLPTRIALVINLKTAKALGLAVPESLLARADEVIE
jgi:putative ABC transport system substrate-binding protein